MHKNINYTFSRPLVDLSSPTVNLVGAGARARAGPGAHLIIYFTLFDAVQLSFLPCKRVKLWAFYALKSAK